MKRKILAGLLLAACLGLAGCAPTQLDLAPYITVSFYGQNGQGTAELTVQEDALAQAVAQAAGLGSETPESGSEAESQVNALLAAVTLDLDVAEGLSNGDTVTLSAQVDESLLEDSRVRFVLDSQALTVSGLDEYTHLDPFESLEVDFSGAAPQVRVELSAGSGFALADSFGYTAEPASGLSAGDVVTVTAACLYDADTLAQMGYVLDRTTATYTVPGTVDRLADGWEAFSASGLARLQSRLTSALESLAREASLPVYSGGAFLIDAAQDLEVTDFALGDSVFWSRTQADSGESCQNRLIAYWSCQVTGSDGETVPCFGAFVLEDLMVTGSGSLSGDFDWDEALTATHLYLTQQELDAAELAYSSQGYTTLRITQAEWADAIAAEGLTPETAAQPEETAAGAQADSQAAAGSTQSSAGDSAKLDAPAATARPTLDYIG